MRENDIVGAAEERGRRRPADAFLSGGTVGRDLVAVDWAATPLGPRQSWPQSLTSAVSTVLRSRFSMWMGWGPKLTFFCNDAYRRDTLGAKYPWALGKPASEVWAEIWPDIGPRIGAVMDRGEATWDEALLLFLERSGYREETYHTFSYSPLSDEAGTVTGMLCVVTEDTERVIGARRMATLRDLGSDPTVVRTEDDVLVSSARYLGGNPEDLPFSLLYTFAPDQPVARLRATNRITPGHQAAPLVIDEGDLEAFWSVRRGALRQSVLVENLDSRFEGLPTGAWDAPPRQALVVPLLQQGENPAAGVFITALNRFRPFDEGYRTFVELVGGQIAARLATARAYETERDRAEQLAELDRAKTAFFTNVSHEFRTPLTLMLGPLEDALADTHAVLPAPQRERFEIVQRNALRLLKLVNTLLDFSRLESGLVGARFEPVDLAGYTAELASAFASATERVNLTLTVICPPLPEPVWVDPDLWAKIVLNLLSNALKFTFEGGITVRLGVRDGRVELAVADTGVGIAPDEQSRLFQRFYRATVSRARTYEGSGIGLALVSELAGLHGGAVRVESTPGVGSEFVVGIPLGNEHLPADQRVAGAVDTPTPMPVAGRADIGRRTEGFLAETQRWLSGDPDAAGNPGQDDERPRVLVIDDNADIRDYLTRLLAGQYSVSTAADGLAGLELARRLQPDLVLSDVMMPRLDGFGVLAALRADPATEHIPLVLLSARAGEESTVEGLEAGADDYLVKPFSARELLARVGANLELDRVRRTRDRLERSQALLDETQRLARVGSWELDLETGSMTASKEMLRQLELSEEDLQSGGFEAVVSARTHPDDLKLVRAAMERTLATGQRLDFEIGVVASDGSTRTYHALGEVVRSSDGRPIRLRASNQDITDQRAAEQAVAASAANREAIAREHRIADELQRSLVPAPTFKPDNLAIATFYRAGVEGTQVGGDWYDVIELGAGRTALVLGDVMGRGVQAAAVMGQLRAAIRAYARLDLPPADVLELLDSAVRDLGEDQIVTCVYAVYDPGDGTLSYVNAGHLPPLLRLPGQPARRLLEATGPPLGIGPITSAAAQISMPAGALLVLYTDGLIERRGTDIDDGVARLAALLTGAEGTLDTLPNRLVEALLPQGPDDDVALLLAVAREQQQPIRSTVVPIAYERRAVHVARAFVIGTLGAWGVRQSVAEDVVLMVSELVTNALVHGKPPVELRLRVTAADLFVQVLDGATALPRQLRPTADDEHGRGLQIVARLADRWGTRPLTTGKAVWCVVSLGGQ